MSFQFVRETVAYSEDPLVNSQYLSVANFARWIRQFESSNYTLASCSWQQREFYEFLLTYNKPVLLFNCFDPMFVGDNNTPLAHYIELLNNTNHVRVVGNNIDDYLNYWCFNKDNILEYLTCIYSKDKLKNFIYLFYSSIKT